MGYVIKDIAVIDEPDVLSLSDEPNFVVFSTKPGGTDVPFEFNVEVRAVSGAVLDWDTLTLFRISTADGTVHTWQGSTDTIKVGGYTYFIGTTASDTAYNMYLALLRDTWLTSLFDITPVYTIATGGGITAPISINVKSKGAGNMYNISVAAPNDPQAQAYAITYVSMPSRSGDTISGSTARGVDIALDIYTNPDTFLGAPDDPTVAGKLGTYAVTLLKAYRNAPLWFDANALWRQYPAAAIPPAGYPAGWFDTQSIKAYRFIASVRDTNSYPFYISPALYVLGGSAPLGDAVELAPDYVYLNSAASAQSLVKPLTHKPLTGYMRGQLAFFNFILSDPDRYNPAPTDYTLHIQYTALSPSGAPLGVIYGQPIARAALAMVNTCVLDIDSVLDAYPSAGIVKVALAKDSVAVSEATAYEILPECLHTLNVLAFVNRLGGWDAYNLDAHPIDEIAPASTTYEATVGAGWRRGDAVEATYSVGLNRSITVDGAPVTDEVAAWLRELAMSPCVLDSEGNRVVIEDMQLSVADDTRDMQAVSITYRYSDDKQY
jgi:hypothetical protein